MDDDPKGNGKYERYVADVTEDISEICQQYGCQPILFIGSGLSRRYFNAPNWEELLTHLADKCSLVDKGIGFYKQSFGDAPSIGEEFANKYHEWAWSKGHNEFPDSMFTPNVGKADYIKYKIAEYLTSLTPADENALATSVHKVEIGCLKQIKPHAIITTNYDEMIERLFPDLTPVVGQHILKSSPVTIGEIFKIHGCVTQPSQIVFTQSDYREFVKKKKFLSAKLLTFFNEHPLIFIGYSATDPNIRSILSDIDEALPEKGGVIPNVYILHWNSSIGPETYPAHDKVIQTEDDRTVRVKLIEASNFSWVFEAFAANPVLDNVNPRVLRALLARSYELVRHDIPKMKIEADFKMLTDNVGSPEAFAKLFGIANISDYSAASAHHRYTATQIAAKLGEPTWHIANKLVERVRREKGVDIKATDNVYHRAEKLNKSIFHKYSEEAFQLLRSVQAGDQYQLKI